MESGKRASTGDPAENMFTRSSVASCLLCMVLIWNTAVRLLSRPPHETHREARAWDLRHSGREHPQGAQEAYLGRLLDEHARLIRALRRHHDARLLRATP